MLLLWFIIEEVCPELRAAYISLWSNNSPTVGWVKRLVARGSKNAIQLMPALTLSMKHKGASPLISLHIQGEKNSMMDIPSQYFGSNPAWLCKTNYDLCNLFNEKTYFPNQAYWTIFSPSSAVSMKVIPIMRMDNFEMVKWLIKKAGNMLAKLDHFRPTFGSGTLVIGCLVPAKSSMPHRLRILHTLRPLW